MTKPVVAHDLRAEESLLGAMLLSREAIRAVSDLRLRSADFYRPAHGHIYDAIFTLYRAGAPVDPVTVADELVRADRLDAIGGAGELVGIQARTPATSSAPHYARIVGEMATFRRLVVACAETIDEVRALPSNPDEFVARVRERFGSFEMPSARERPVYWSVSDFAARQDKAERDWLIEPFLERGERMLIVAGVGSGKSVFMRQLAVASAAGVNPFLLSEMKPVRSLTVDLENPDGIVIRSLARLDRMARWAPQFDQERAAVWHMPGGINIRVPSGFDSFDEVLADHAPDLVCVGPLYKLFRKERGESDEDAALDVLARLDDLRGRHKFVLVLEHHAPHGSELRPFGSSVLQRWPEFGPALTLPSDAKGDRSRLLWGDWRGPREQRPWPRLVMHGGADQWPWLCVWDDGKRPDFGPQQGTMEAF